MSTVIISTNKKDTRANDYIIIIILIDISLDKNIIHTLRIYLSNSFCYRYTL